MKKTLLSSRQRAGLTFGSRGLLSPNTWRKSLFAVAFFMVALTGFSQLSGVKTINPSGSGANNYVSFTAAVNDLVAKGVNGPVLFQVSAGTYSGQIAIPAITGASATNTITFDGGFGNANTRILTFAATSTTDAFTVRLNSTSYVILKNLSIRNTGTAAGLGVHIFGTTNNCSIINCHIAVDSSSTSANFKAIQMTNNTLVTDGSLCGGSSASTFNIVIDSNDIVGGNFSYYGTSSYSTTSVPFILFMRANKLRKAYQSAIGINNLNGYQINYNFIDMRTTNNNNYGFSHCNGSTSGSQLYEMIGNTFANCGQYGIYSLTRNSNGARGRIWNNFFRGDWRNASARALNLGYDRNFDIWANTIVMQNDLTNTGAGIYIYPSSYPNDVRNNNIIISGTNSSGLALYSEGGCLSGADYNNYYKANNSPGQFLNVINGSNVTKANYKGFGGFDANSYSEDPMLTSATDPRPGSICLKGIFQSVLPRDINNVVRLNPPTVGCAENAGGLNLDAEINAFLKPTFPVSSGNNDIEVRIKNKGLLTLTSLNVSVTIGSTTKTINWTGNLTSCSEASVLFTGSNQFTINPGKNTVTAYIDSPNAGNDQNKGNDTLKTNFCTPFSAGTYTIDPSGTGPNNYTSFAEVAEILNCGGITGAVQFNVAAATFNEKLDLLYVKGVSKTNTILFNGAGIGSSILQLPATTNAAIVSIAGTSHVTVQNMSLRATSNTNVAAVKIASQSDSVKILNNSIEFSAFSNFTTFGVTFGDYNTNTAGNESTGSLVEGNNFVNCYYGIQLRSASTTARSSKITIRKNNFTGLYGYGVYVNYAAEIDVDMNNFTFGNFASSYGYYSNSGVTNTIRNNNFKNLGIYGMYIINENNNTVIYNNMLADFLTTSTGTYGGIYTSSTSGLKIYHNTIYFNPQTTATTGSRAALHFNFSNNADIKNNIFVYAGASTRGVAVSRNTSSNNCTFENNLYYSTADIYTEDYTTFYKNLTDWQAVSPTWNLKSLQEQPLFVNTTFGSVDAHLQSSYDAPSGDLTLGINVDVDGDVRCAGSMTMGADQSSYPQLVPVSTFVVADSVYEGSGTRIVNTTKGEPTKYTYRWYVDGILASTTRDLDYQFGVAGNYDVKLAVDGCSGSDSLSKTVSVIVPTSTPKSDFVATPQIVDLYAMVNLRDNSSHGPTIWQWTASPASDAFFSNDADQHPTIFFGKSGFYDVCLSTENNLGVGKDTCKNSYIFVKEEYSMCGSSSNPRTTARFGKLYDDGGPTGNYGTNRNCTYLINPCATSITLRFTQFALAAGEVLNIYNGSNASAPLIGSYTSASPLPGGSTGLVATSGQLFISWVTDGTTQAAGFAAEWSSVADNTPAPVANFSFPDTLFIDEDIRFTSTSTGTNLSYLWDFDPPFEIPGNEGGEKNFDVYSYGTSGNYNVKLKVVNCAGSNSITKSITVLDPITAPAVDFVADKTMVAVNALVTFTNNTKHGPLNYRWEFSPSTGVNVKPNKNSKNITANFLVPGTYTVKLVAGNSIGDDSLIKTSYITVYDYCDPGVASVDGKIGISNVTFGAINNTTTSGVAKYSNYINLPQFATVTKGGKYPLSVSRTNTVDEMNRKVWIDWNIDGDFDDSLELVAFEGATRNATFNTIVKVPATASEGFTRMRVGVSYGNDANHACGLNRVGEFEDYTVNIIGDGIAPVITLNGANKVTFEQWYQYVEAGFTAMDDIDSSLTNVVSVTSNVDSTTVGMYQVKYEVSDVAGNKTIVTRDVEVTPDVTNPVLTLTGASTIDHDVKTTYTDAGATAMDYLNRNFTSSIVVTNNVNDQKVGAYVVAYEVTDLAGNKALINRTVNVVDRVAPIIAKVGDTVFVEVKSPYTEPGISATDNYDASVSVVSGAVNVNKTGTYVLNYTATDTAGNSSNESRVVIVRDTQKPVITINGLDTVIVNVFSNYNELGATVADNYCTGLTTTPSIVVNTNKLGDYLVNYDVTDCEGNVAVTKTRVVKVVDRVAPVLQLKGFVSTNKIMRWKTYTDSGVTYSDNYYSAAELVPNLKVTSNVNTLAEGIYEYCYDLTDPSGNIAQRVCRTVEVIANTTGITEEYLENAVNVYPNPTRGELNVAVKFDQNREVKVTVVNLLGEVITSITPQTVLENNFNIDMSAYASGLYLVRIEADGMVLVKKVNLVK